MYLLKEKMMGGKDGDGDTLLKGSGGDDCSKDPAWFCPAAASCG